MGYNKHGIMGSTWDLFKTKVLPLLPVTTTEAGLAVEKQRSSGIRFGSFLFYVCR